MLSRESLETELESMKKQHAQALETAQQAIGAISVLEWMISQLNEIEVVDNKSTEVLDACN